MTISKVTIGFLLGLSSAFGCSCVGFSSFSEKLPDQSDLKVAVFTAKALRFDEAPPPVLPAPVEKGSGLARRPGGRIAMHGGAIPTRVPERRVVFQTMEVFWGPLKGSMDAFTPQSTCGLDFVVGETYLVEARLWPPDKPIWSVTLCSRTRLLRESEQNLQTLRLWQKGERTPGRVTGEVWIPKERKNIAGVRIQLTNSERTLTTHTGHNGQFSFENVPPGRYEAVADLPTNNRQRVDLREAWLASWVVFSVGEP